MNRQGLIALFRASAIVVLVPLVACQGDAKGASPQQADMQGPKAGAGPDGGLTDAGFDAGLTDAGFDAGFDGGLFDGGLDGGTATIYNPYPPGILPADLASELSRVQREVGVIFEQARAAWLALPTPTVTGQPPTVQGTGYQQMQTLGRLMNFDLNISPFRDVACASCHMPYAGFSGPIPSVNLTMVAYPGSFRFRAGKRTAQRHPYSPFFPVLQYNQEQGLFFGGNFWDSRATGYKLRVPDAEQAQGPPVDTLEMGFPDTACVSFRLSQVAYRPLFEEVWGKGSLEINFPRETAEIC